MLSVTGGSGQRRIRRALLAHLLLLPGIAAAQLGPEFVVNSTTVGNQTQPDVAADSAGNFTVVWTGPDGAGNGAFVRRFNTDGSPRGAESRVNPDIAGEESEPSVAVDGSGRFVVSYTAADSDGTGIYARRYTATGLAIDSRPFRVNFKAARNQTLSKVALSSSGALVVAWRRSSSAPEEEEQAAEFRLYGDNGKAVTEDVVAGTALAITGINDGIRSLAVARHGDGRFAIAYLYCTDCGDELGRTFVKSYGATGTLLGTSAFYMRFQPSIAASGAGYVLVADDSGDDITEDEVYATRLDGNGAVVSSELSVSGLPGRSSSRDADVAGTPSGQFVVVAEHISNISGRRYSAENTALTPYVRVGSPGTRYRYSPRVALGANGNGVAVWIDGGFGDHGLDGDAGGITARRLTFGP